MAQETADSSITMFVTTYKAFTDPDAQLQLVSILQVLYIGEGIAIIQGLHNDAPVGTKLGFVSGASGSAFHIHNTAVWSKDYKSISFM